MNGRTTMQTMVGTEAAISHDPKPISTPDSLAIAAPSGLPAIAVSQSADDSVRLTIPENIRNLPNCCRSARSGLAPAASAIDTASGYSTPERAVLLGNAGAIMASTMTMLYESPSDERPKRLIARYPSRWPRPHFTTARATRNAMMIKTIVGLANPAYAASGVSVRVRTAAAIASTDAV